MGIFKIGILDFGDRNDSSGIQILEDVFKYSSLADKLGFSSFWLGEHHNSEGGWSNPEILLPLIAGYTDKINVGIAGILLALHSPYRVALNFKLLANLFPGRIDLGLANGKPDIRIAQKLLHDFDGSFSNYFHPKIKELLTYFQEDQKLWEQEKIIIPPANGKTPNVWKLTTSFDGLSECIENKLNVSRSMFHFHNHLPFDKSQIIEFKNQYFSANGSFPRINLAIAGICDQTKRSAQNTLIKSGLKDQPVFVGTPSYFKEKFLELHERSGIDEFIFYDRAVGFKRRMNTLNLLANELLT